MIRQKTQASQWRNSTDVISWFKSIPCKERKSFISFDITDFYLSISEQLLDRSISWARQFTDITEKDINIIKHARKSLLFHKNQSWSKRNTDSVFDVTMGSFDGAEVCELVGLFILNSLQERFGENVGLYRDDGLAVVNTRSGRLCDKESKELIRIFNDFGFKITVQTNQQRTSFLDLTFDLTEGIYKPYRKPNDDPVYINHSSNHPPPIIRELPHSINRRINLLSSNKETFNEAAQTYNDALKRIDFNNRLKYEPPESSKHFQTQRRHRQRHIIWYNPPYSKSVKTNIARDFLQLIDKHFPRNNRLHKLFNRHTVPVSYSCSENMKTYIKRHNNKILKRHDSQDNPPNTNSTLSCNCRNPMQCPVKGNCLQSSVLYEARVTTTDNKQTRSYIGVTGDNFKTRYRNHCKSLNSRKYKNETELSKHVWNLKDNKR